MIRSCLRSAPARLRHVPIRSPARLGGSRRTYAQVTAPRSLEPTELDKITRLPNGIRVATEALPDAFSGVGVYIDAGSRFENDYLRGTSHIMDRLAFKSTKTQSAAEVLETVETLGGNIQCASSREAMMYQAATFNSAIPATVGLLAETIRDPQLTDEEITQQLATAEYEIKEIWSKPELILPELVHMAAFKDNTLGQPLLCPQERLKDINRDVIQAYRETFYRPEKIVVAFAGLPHAEAIKLTEQYFGDMKSVDAEVDIDLSEPSPTGSESSIDSATSSVSEATTYSSSSISSQPSKLLSRIPFFQNLSTSASNNASVSSQLILPQDPITAPAHYTGGFLTLPPQPPSPNPNLPTFTHIHLAFEGLPISSDDIYALATLQTILGGGGSFSAGGPGKGMYSRLYTNVLNVHGWVESCISFNHSYTDSGLFGISAACYSGYTSQMLEVMCRELRNLALDTGTRALTEIEVSRAKNQLRSSLLMNLESRMVELEDLGRQVQVHGRKIPVHEMTKKIEQLTVQDLRRVAKMVVGGMVKNPGGGTGAPTVVLQETQEGARKSLGWERIQEVVYKWQLGRRE